MAAYAYTINPRLTLIGEWLQVSSTLALAGQSLPVQYSGLRL